jgi:hypothetical protein
MSRSIADQRLGHTSRGTPAACHSNKMIKVLAAILVLGTSDAMAMNQEGHDGGWMTDFPPGLLLLEAIPEARPLPSARCPVSSAMLAVNPYEQIQLPRHGCRPDLQIEVKPETTANAKEF